MKTLFIMQLNIKNFAKKIIKKHKEIGTFKLLMFIVFYIFKKSHNKNLQESPVVVKDPINWLYNLISQQEYGIEVDKQKLDRKTINWIIPDFQRGSGGHSNIFRFIGNLEKQGFKCHINFLEPCQFKSTQKAYEYICEHFNFVKASVSIGVDFIPPAWITIATGWHTAYVVRNLCNTVLKCYFIQDFEPFFYGYSSDYFFAEGTYRFGFYGLTGGHWLAQKLNTEYGMRTEAFSFSYDKHIYTPRKRLNPEKQQIFFYARPVTPRRGFELGTLVLLEVARKLPHVTFVFAGWDVSDYTVPFNHVNLGVLSPEQLADVYSQCDAALVLSFTNISLAPLEIMACGCPVVSNKGSNVEWLLNENNSILREANIEDLSQGLVELLNNEQLRQQKIKAGLDFVQQTDWLKEAQKLKSIFERLTDEFENTLQEECKEN